MDEYEYGNDDERETQAFSRDNNEYEGGEELYEGGDIDTESTFKDRERVSENNDCSTSTEQDERSLTPEERFRRSVGIIIYNMRKNNYSDIEDVLTSDIRNELCQTVDKIDFAKYLNASAYIMGYIITKGGENDINNLDKKLVKKVFDYLSQLEDESVKPPDVLRYARLWHRLKHEYLV